MSSWGSHSDVTSLTSGKVFRCGRGQGHEARGIGGTRTTESRATFAARPEPSQRPGSRLHGGCANIAHSSLRGAEDRSGNRACGRRGLRQCGSGGEVAAEKAGCRGHCGVGRGPANRLLGAKGRHLGCGRRRLENAGRRYLGGAWPSCGGALSEGHVLLRKRKAACVRTGKQVRRIAGSHRRRRRFHRRVGERARREER